MLGSFEREVVTAHVGILETLLDATPEKSASAEAETLVHIGKLMLALPGQRSNEAGAEATGEAYQAALDDLPPWSVAAAIRLWYRGAAPAGRVPHDYRWRPAPAVLRAVAFGEYARVRGRVIALRGLLEAHPLAEYTDEHRAMMLTKLSAVMHAVTDKKVQPPAQLDPVAVHVERHPWHDEVTVTVQEPAEAAQ